MSEFEPVPGLEDLKLVEATVLRLQPGDALAITAKRPISIAVARRVKQVIEAQLPGVPVVVLDDMGVDVLRQLPSCVIEVDGVLTDDEADRIRAAIDEDRAPFVRRTPRRVA